MTELPPGQRESATFHRFGLLPFAKRFPSNPTVPVIKISGMVEQPLEILDPFENLQRIDQISDFHCVTTWSVTNLHWGGVLFRDFYNHVIKPKAKPNKMATLVRLKAQDGARTGMLLEDLMASNVILADSLNGRPLCVDHGAPIRLVAPHHYAYKSVKYLSELHFVSPQSGYRATGFEFMDHPRARVEYEERGRGLPGVLFRYLYRPLIKHTASHFANASIKRQQDEDRDLPLDKR